MIDFCGKRCIFHLRTVYRYDKSSVAVLKDDVRAEVKSRLDYSFPTPAELLLDVRESFRFVIRNILDFVILKLFGALQFERIVSVFSTLRINFDAAH